MLISLKVAAYSAEFDAIVVLGFPTEAIDLIAPGKRLPGVGERLLVVSLFTQRCAHQPPVQGDINMGPRSYSKHTIDTAYCARFWVSNCQA